MKNKFRFNLIGNKATTITSNSFDKLEILRLKDRMAAKVMGGFYTQYAKFFNYSQYYQKGGTPVLTITVINQEDNI